MQDITLLVKKTKIPKETLEVFRALSRTLNNKEGSKLEIAALQKILAESLANMDINKKLDRLADLDRNIRYDIEHSGISSDTVKIIRNISYRSRHLSKISNDLASIYARFEQAKAGKKLEVHEKITLAQYGTLYDLACLNEDLKKMNDLGLMNGNQTLENLFDQTQKAQIIIDHLDDTFDQSFKAPTGSVMFDNASDKNLVYGRHFSFFKKIIDFFVTKFNHVSKIIFSEKNNKISHINPNYEEDDLSMRSYLYSEIYKIKLENSITPAVQKILKEKLGDDWLKQLEAKYASIERELHNKAKEQHAHIVADETKTRDIKIATVLLQGGHKNFFFANHSNKDIRDNFFGRGIWENRDNKKTKLLCSEFIGMSLIAAIQELNDQVKKELEIKGVKDLPNTLIKSPISQREKLQVLTPERLLTTMQKRGVVEKVETPSEISQFIARKI